MLEHVDLRHTLVLDIETVPQYSSFQEVPAEYQSLWEHKTRFQRRDGESAAEFYNRGGIWAEFGKIVCISVGLFSARSERLMLRVKSYYGNDELAILLMFCATLNQLSPTTTLCAHNGREFDFPYLCRRMLINNIPIPAHLHIHGKKPWEVNQVDTMDLWKFGDYKNYTSLKLLAAAFGIPSPKDDIDGSEVHEVYWKEKNLVRIKTYCEKDVITTAQLLLKFKSLPLLSAEQIAIIQS